MIPCVDVTLDSESISISEWLEFIEWKVSPLLLMSDNESEKCTRWRFKLSCIPSPVGCWMKEFGDYSRIWIILLWFDGREFLEDVSSEKLHKVKIKNGSKKNPSTLEMEGQNWWTEFNVIARSDGGGYRSTGDGYL